MAEPSLVMPSSDRKSKSSGQKTSTFALWEVTDTSSKIDEEVVHHPDVCAAIMGRSKLLSMAYVEADRPYYGSR